MGTFRSTRRQIVARLSYKRKHDGTPATEPRYRRPNDGLASDDYQPDRGRDGKGGPDCILLNVLLWDFQRNLLLAKELQETDHGRDLILLGEVCDRASLIPSTQLRLASGTANGRG